MSERDNGVSDWVWEWVSERELVRKSENWLKRKRERENNLGRENMNECETESLREGKWGWKVVRIMRVWMREKVRFWEWNNSE